MEAFDGEESEVKTWDIGLQGAQGGTAKRQKDGSGPRTEGKAKRRTMPVEKPARAKERGRQLVGKEERRGKACPSLLEAFEFMGPFIRHPN